MRIFLVGYMASGKTTLGRALATNLGYRFIDLDDYIETKGKKTIKQIFDEAGEEYFRFLESEALKEVTSLNGDFVISSGGGTSCFYCNIDFMNNNGITIYLRMEVATLVSRLVGSKERPLLLGKSKKELTDFIIQALDERKKFYEKAQIIIDADRLNADDLTKLIFSSIK
ncbi:MAG TPA: shikimate kinase [Tenuifilaceae bacterium]|nr:shikimate kinase [Tenuifilaceae bacterium]